MTRDWPAEETDDPLYADRRNFYKVEKWSRDGLRVELMLYAGQLHFHSRGGSSLRAQFVIGRSYEGGKDGKNRQVWCHAGRHRIAKK